MPSRRTLNYFLNAVVILHISLHLSSIPVKIPVIASDVTSSSSPTVVTSERQREVRGRENLSATRPSPLSFKLQTPNCGLACGCELELGCKTSGQVTVSNGVL